MSQPTFLDIDAIVPEKEVVIKLDGAEHHLAPITVEQFIANIQTMQRLSAGNLDVGDEKNMIVGMLEQAFPTVPEGRFNKLTLKQLNVLVDFAQKNSGESEVKEQAQTEAKPAQDPQTGG